MACFGCYSGEELEECDASGCFGCLLFAMIPLILAYRAFSLNSADGIFPSLK